MKYKQSEETRYYNNEYDNMPSIDYSCVNAPKLTRKNNDKVDWERVKLICDKYGFKHTLINSTFCGDDVVCVIYLKTDISADYYQECYKALCNNEEGAYGKFKKFGIDYEWAIKKMHDCVHELDEETDLLFDCNWVGNCGLFGSHDTRKKSYCGCGNLTRWNVILDRWSPHIHDTRSKLSKGVYVMMDTTKIKPAMEESPSLEEFEPKLLEIVKGFLSDKYTADFEHGKRQCDTDTDGYRALVIRYKGGDYCGMVTFNRDWLGRYHILTACPLAGQSSWIMDWKNPKEDLESAVRYFAN